MKGCEVEVTPSLSEKSQNFVNGAMVILALSRMPGTRLVVDGMESVLGMDGRGGSLPNIQSA